MNAGLSRWMDEKGHTDIASFRGAICERIVGMEQVFRDHVLRAQIDAAACNGCGICQRVCIYDAAVPGDDGYTVLPDRCDGCGLCVELCPATAITMVGR